MFFIETLKCVLNQNHIYYFCTDKRYIGAEVKLNFSKLNIRLECPYRYKSEIWKLKFIPFVKAIKRFETLFSQHTNYFLVLLNIAKLTNGLFAWIVGKFSALTVLQ